MIHFKILRHEIENLLHFIELELTETQDVDISHETSLKQLTVTMLETSKKLAREETRERLARDYIGRDQRGSQIKLKMLTKVSLQGSKYILLEILD